MHACRFYMCAPPPIATFCVAAALSVAKYFCRLCRYCDVVFAELLLMAWLLVCQGNVKNMMHYACDMVVYSALRN